ncbi:DUF3124 domain-containing protein [Lutibacter maritimus]|uniref:DUF3124 domain-containing protein n=1 Tax=Lutibacter maritimus TaxID=593133 RepID=A0A1I6PIM8_9FLAO|nr:DUF3124 domain-containing protein [Lutibacter maritimus]SFS40029.1 Protein of unknown function [Lutibacter maritimus]
MKKITLLLCISILFISCENSKEISSIAPINWEKRTLNSKLSDSLQIGKSYLSVYSQIYSTTEHRTHSLTVTVSMRNTNLNDSIFINNASYFDTEGNLIRTYFNKPIFLKPMETVEIVIDELDKQGGTGANFIFDWAIKQTSNEPLFEGIMISTSGQQGLSFSTIGKKITH